MLSTTWRAGAGVLRLTDVAAPRAAPGARRRTSRKLLQQTCKRRDLKCGKRFP